MKKSDTTEPWYLRIMQQSTSAARKRKTQKKQRFIEKEKKTKETRQNFSKKKKNSKNKLNASKQKAHTRILWHRVPWLGHTNAMGTITTELRQRNICIAWLNYTNATTQMSKVYPLVPQSTDQTWMLYLLRILARMQHRHICPHRQ